MISIPNIPLKINLLNEYFFKPRIFNPANKLNNGIKKAVDEYFEKKNYLIKYFPITARAVVFL